MAQVTFLLSKSLQNQINTGTCVEAGMAGDFQSARQSALAKDLRFASADIEKKKKQKLQQTNQPKRNLCSSWAKPLSIFDGRYKRSKAEVLCGFEFFLW